jgi:hypothetical protein
MEEPPLVSLNTMSVRQTFWGRTREPPARSSLLMVERPPAIKFDNRAKVPWGMVIGSSSASATIHLKLLIKLRGARKQRSLSGKKLPQFTQLPAIK